MTIDESAERLRRIKDTARIGAHRESIEMLVDEIGKLQSALRTEQTMHSAWRKRAEESETERPQLMADIDRLRNENGLFRHELALRCSATEKLTDEIKRLQKENERLQIEASYANYD